jgi:hypothetical protein
MATPDHTAHARSLNSSDVTSASTSGGPSGVAGAIEFAQPLYRSKAEGIAVAVSAIRRLLADSDAYQYALANGLPTEPSHSLRTSVDADGLETAVHYLNQYAKTLGREPRSARFGVR